MRIESMATVAATPTKVNRAFYGFLENVHGIFLMDAGVVIHMSSETEELRVVEAGMSWQALGEVGTCECQALRDRMHGGAAMIACARLQEVA
jgi:hypothetical protein